MNHIKKNIHLGKSYVDDSNGIENTSRTSRDDDSNPSNFGVTTTDDFKTRRSKAMKSTFFADSVVKKGEVWDINEFRKNAKQKKPGKIQELYNIIEQTNEMKGRSPNKHLLE